MGFVLAIYAIGVIAGLLLTDARPPARVAIALAWPLGVAAFFVTIAILLLAAMLVFPIFGLAVVVVLAGLWALSSGPWALGSWL